MSDIESYLRIMHDFKPRLYFTACYMNDNIYKDESVTIMHIENYCLQIRKMLEMIVMVSLANNKGYFEKAKKKFFTSMENKTYY